MNDHDWTRDYVATYLANGLNDEERTKLETHIGGCAACAAVLDETRAFDLSLNEIFAPVRPDPAIEDRVIHRLRTRPTMSSSAARPFWVRIGLGVAALVTIGALGHLVSADDEGGPVSETAVAMRSDRRQNRDRHYSDDKAAMSELANRPASTLGLAAPSEDAAIIFAASGESDHNESLALGDMKGDIQDALSFSSGLMERAGAGGGGFRGRAESERSVLALAEDGRVAGKLQDDFYAYKDSLKNATPQKENQFYSLSVDPGHSAADLKKLSKSMDKSDALAEKRKMSEEIAKEPNRTPSSRPPSAAAPTGGKPAASPLPQDPPPQHQRKIIRNGELEYEIENFDSAVSLIMKIVAEEKGYVATVNSEKLENGKVRGEIVLRCPPENLDTLVLKLRGLGELKGQKITSEDVTKQFFDTDSKLRAARQMEGRLLEIIKSGKGEIKDLLEAERQLGEYRQKIEVMEGELRYLNNLVSLCTLRLRLLEKNIRTAASATETETVSMGIEAEEVEKQYQAALTAIGELKGRITGSEMKRYEAGQYHARIQAEVAPDSSGTLRDRLKMLGNVARLDVDRQVVTDGTGTPTGPLKKNDSKFDISIYNIINIAPRESYQINIATDHAEGAYAALLAKLKDEKSGSRIVSSNLNRQRGDRTTGFIHFEVKSDLAEAMLAAVKSSGEVMRLVLTENTDTRNVTKAKKGFQLNIFALGAVQPRETSVVHLAVKEVAGSFKALQAEVAKLEGRILAAHLNESNPQRLSGIVDFEVRREDEAAMAVAMKAAGDVYSRVTKRAEDSDNVVDSKVRIQLTLLNAANVPPKETWTIGIESRDVKKATETVKGLGRIVHQDYSTDPSGTETVSLTVDVPLAQAGGAVNQVKDLGRVRSMNASKDPNVPDGDFAVARLNVTLSSGEQVIPNDQGFTAQINKGLAAAFKAIGYSLQILIVGLIVVLPIGLIAWWAWKMVKRAKASPTT